jgi:adenylate kinase family enzyme
VIRSGDPMIKIPKRVVIIGSSCAGKTTFANKLAATIGAKHIELDALHWEPNWKEADGAVFRARVQAALDSDSWVVDGNYREKIKDIVWPIADTLIWLDPSLTVVLRRFFLRSFRRSMSGELLWGHSKETLRNNIFSKNSLLMWILSTHKKRTASYLKLLENPPTGVAVFRLRSEKQVTEFFRQLSN